MSLEIFQEKKETFLDFENNTFKKAKTRNFPKGLTYDFGEKIENFSLLFCFRVK